MTVPTAVSATQSGPTRSRGTVATALTLVGVVWLGACAWSYSEQIRLATHFGFDLPWLFPLMLDGLATALAVTAWSAALDGRTGVLLRLFTAAGVAGSAWVNGAEVLARTHSPNPTELGMAMIAPVVAWIGFEFILAELRRVVLRTRGLPAPVPVPSPRLIRVAIAPFTALREWRQLALELTDPRRQVNPDDLPPVPPVPARPISRPVTAPDFADLSWLTPNVMPGAPGVPNPAR